MTISKQNIGYHRNLLEQIFENNSSLLDCPECYGPLINDEFSGETICNHCGLIVDEKAIDPSSEKIIYTQKQREKRERTGRPIDVFITHLGETTYIQYYRIKNPDLKRIFVWDKRMKNTSSFRALNHGRAELLRIGSCLRLPSIHLSIAMLLFRKAQEKKMAKGKTIESLIIACLYYACRKLQYPIAFKELVNASAKPNVNKSQKAYRDVFQAFTLSVPPLGPETFISRYCSDLGLSFKFEQNVRKMLKKIPKMQIMGRDPKGIIAGIIYLLARKDENLKITQKQLSDLVYCTRLSIRNQVKLIRKYVEKV